MYFAHFDFPNMAAEGYTKTSERCPKYNCIAWALEDQDNWWWPYQDLAGNEGYWPSSVQRKLSLKAFTDVFKTRGYKKCDDGTFEKGFEKIAIFTKGTTPTHAARQLPTGVWTHKMGLDIDVTASLTSVEGPAYGNIARYMRRKFS